MPTNPTIGTDYDHIDAMNLGAGTGVVRHMLKDAQARTDIAGMNTATTEDVGKALKPKTVSGGKVTEWEFGDVGVQVDDTLTQAGKAADAKKTGDEVSDLKSAIDDFNVEVFGGVGEGFPLEFENGTYEFTATGKTLIKYYGGGYDLTRKVVKSTTFTLPCKVNVKAKTGYSFTVFLSTDGVITSNTGLITEYTMQSGQQYGMTLRTTGGSDDISSVPVASIIDIEYISRIDDISALGASVGDRIGALETSVGAEVSSTFTKSGTNNATKFITYPIVPGQQLMFKWTTEGGSNQTLNLFTRDSASGANIETVRQTAHPSTYYEFTAGASAAGLFLSATASGTIYVYNPDTVTGSVEALETAVTSMQGTVSTLKSTVGEEITASFVKAGDTNATLFIPYPVTPGYSLRFKWTTDASGNQEINLFTRNSASGANIETVKLTAHPSTYYEFTAGASAAGLFLSATASGTIYLYDKGTIVNDLDELAVHIDDVAGELQGNIDDVAAHITNERAAALGASVKYILAQNGNHTGSNIHARLYTVNLRDAFKVRVTSARYASWTTSGPIIAFYSGTTLKTCTSETLILAGTEHASTGATFTEEYDVPAGAKYALVQSSDDYESTYGAPSVTLYSVTVLQDIADVQSEIGAETVRAFTKPSTANATLYISHTVTPGSPLLIEWVSANGDERQEMNLYTRNSSSGANIETIRTGLHPNKSITFNPTAEASGVFLSATGSGTIYLYDKNTIIGSLADDGYQIDALKQKAVKQPLVRFSFSDIMFDPSAIFAAGGEMGAIAEWPNAGADALAKVHAAFDALIASGGAGYGFGTRLYPQDGSQDGMKLYKESASDTALFDILAPSYVINGVQQGETITLDIGTDTSDEPVTYNYTYESATAPYDVRLYKFADTNSGLHTDTVNIPKKKLLIIGGTHGNEFCAPINLYVFAKHLCSDYANPDMLKLRSSYDVYFIPYLNGFGCQYRWNNQGYMSTGARSNGHMVDINRNCDTFGWTGTTGSAAAITAAFESKLSNLAVNTFAGPSMGSEFEAKLLKAIIDWLKPDVVIDHHHNEGTNPFYTMCYGDYAANLIYQAANDVAYAMLKNLPQYYGTKYNLFLSSTVSPASKAAANGYVTTMAYEQGVKMNATSEMSQSISYLNGVYDATTRQNTKFSADVFKVSEYSLFNVILHLAQYALEH